VAKRAYILARQLEEYEGFAQRVRAIFFLATPHRGSNLAELLSRILQVTPGTRPFVTDLHPNSSIIESINHEFPRHCQSLQLHSFYETMPMNFGLKKSIVVPKDSATLGYPNERTTYLNANHREVCKFANEEDPNYLAIRNSLASALGYLRNTFVLKRREIDYAQQQWLNDSLGVDDAPDDDYLRVDSFRMPGSCAWIAERHTYQHWRDSSDPQIYWITAKPGTGKSVLSGYVIKHLKDFDHSCAFYFFTYDDKSKSNIGLFLRSIAWQMSSTYSEVFDFLLKTCKKDPQLAKADYRTIWRKIFLEGIFKLALSRPVYWIIDALDECKNDSELVPLLVKAAEIASIRIFLTSRNRFESYGQPTPRSLKIVSETVPPESTKADIRLYLKANIDGLPALGPDKDEARDSTMEQVLEKSSGCFLWVRLVLQELRRVHTAAEIRQVLENVPSDMDELYMRILDQMSTLPYGKRLAKAILTWTVCSARPLSTDELYHALQIDINDNIDSVQRSIASSCGQLVYIDAYSRVQMVHQTARDFLLHSDNKSEFAIDRRAGHKRLAMVCLKYLSGSEMTGPKHRKLSASVIAKERCPFVAYACNSLWEHIAFVSSEDDEFLTALARFLNSSNVLTWIEYIAKDSDLNRLIQTGRSFRYFLQRRSRHVVLFGKDVALLDAWAIDLVRLVTKFGRNLATSPSSIFQLIPPFCPSDTAIKKQFATSSRSITVSGLSATTWDDCSSTITYQQDTPSALACSASLFAVGLASGRITIYHETTCQELRTISHGEAVKGLEFGDNGDLLASAGLKSICIWDVHTSKRLWELDISSNCLSYSFVDNDRLLLGAFRNNQLLVWDLTTGLCRELTSWLDELDEEYSGHSRRPICATLAAGSNLLAVVYRGQDLIVWDIDNERLYDIYGKETGSLGARARKRAGIASVWSLMFSRAPEAGLLAAAFNDGELVVFNTFEGTVQARAPANAHTLASSPDGLTLACGNSGGTIHLFEFDSLKLLYRIQSEEFGIRSLVFTANSLRLIDIRGPHCRVWDPPVLVRPDADEENSDTISVSTAPQDYTLDDAKLSVHITALACAEDSGIVFCGKVDGAVCQYDATTGQQIGVLFCHSVGVSIVSLCFDAQSCILSSADSSSRTMAHKLVRDQSGWSIAATIMDDRTGIAVDALLCNTGCTRLLVCTASKDTLWSFEPSSSEVLTVLTWDTRRLYRWFTHPTNQDQLVLIMDNVAHLYKWQSLTKLTADRGIQMAGSVPPELAIRSVTPCFNGNVVATTFTESLASRSKSKLMLWNTFELSLEAAEAAQNGLLPTATPIPDYQPLADQVEHLIGTYGQKVVFLHQDGWVCSADSQNFDVEYFDRHFFVPADWLSTTGGLMLEIFRNGNIVCVQRDELAVIRRGMEHFEQGQSRGIGKRPPLTRSAMSDPLLEKVPSMALRSYAMHISKRP
jgi:WD40 repeat protein